MASTLASVGDVLGAQLLVSREERSMRLLRLSATPSQSSSERSL